MGGPAVLGNHPDEDEDDRSLRLLRRLVQPSQLDSLPVPEPLVHGVLYLDSLVWLQGRPGSAKSFLALDLAASVAAERTWQGFATTAVHVLYVVAEGTSGLRQRVRAWESANGHKLADQTIEFLPVAVQATNEFEWSAFVDLADGIPYNLIVLDTQARMTVGAEENSARDMGLFVRQLERLRAATRACVVVVHHQGRTGEHMRGSTAMEGAATTIVQVSKEDDLVTVRCLKQKDAPPFEDISLRLIPYDSSAVLALTGPTTMDSVSAILGERWLSLWWERFESDEVSVTRLVKAEVVTEATFHRRKFPLLRSGHIEKTGNGNATRYRLTKDPRS